MKSKILSACIALSFLPVTSMATEMTTKRAVHALGLTELAQTYSQEKMTRSSMAETKYTIYDAVLVDAGIINIADMDNKERLSNTLQRFVSDHLMTNEKYLGNISDKNIVERVLNSWSNASVIEDKSKLKLLNSFIDKGYTSGYNVIDTQYNANFDKTRMLRYGHSDIKHAVQLIYLMKSEGFNPKVQLIPKSSAFLYLKEWGEPSYPVTTLDSEKMVAVVKEYNLDFEFETIERKSAFMALINQYAKKDSADEKGLIVESWWQPFYRSYSKMDGYKVLTENQLVMGTYQADLMSLPEKAEKQLQQIKSVTKKYPAVGKQVWVNPSFYRYMKGQYK